MNEKQFFVRTLSTEGSKPVEEKQMDFWQQKIKNGSEEIKSFHTTIKSRNSRYIEQEKYPNSIEGKKNYKNISVDVRQEPVRPSS